MYRVVTGWYPSENTAKKILQKVKAKTKCEVKKSSTGYTVELWVSQNLDTCRKMKNEFIRKGVYCGVEVYDL